MKVANTIIVYIGLMVSSAISIYRYVCCGCGYIEEWIGDKVALDKMYKKFSKYA